MSDSLKPAIIYVVAYLFLDWVSYLHPVLPLAITPWNPPPALSVAFVLWRGPWQWPWLFLAALLAELLVRDIPVAPGWLMLAAAVLSVAYTALAVFLRRLVVIDVRLTSLRDLTWLTGGSLVVALVAGLGYVGLYTAAGIAAQGDFLVNVLRFWIGDLTGLLVTLPLLLLLAGKPAWRPLLQREVWLQAGSLALALWVIFGIGLSDEFKFFYLLFLPLVWIATRHGLLGAALALAATQVGLLVALQWGGHHDTTVMEFQMLLLGLTVTGLFLGMSVSIRQSAEDRLHQRDAELNQALRLAAAGEMAQALAHELNQPLSALASYARASQMMLAGSQRDDNLLAETLQKISAEAGRAGQVVRQLREFFRGGSLRLEVCPVVELVEEGLVSLRKRAERHGIALRSHLPEDLPDVLVDRVQIGTVLLNLLGNAIDAVKGGTPGKHGVEIRAESTGQGMVRVCISDSGVGIAPEMRERLFQPFATSKVDGMGLGLAISRTLVEAHGGELTLESAHPACFCFTLPVEDGRNTTHV